MLGECSILSRQGISESFGSSCALDMTINEAGGGDDFDALDVSNLQPLLWLDASDPMTLFDETTGGNLVGANGFVARWNDKSGNDRNIIQSTIGSRPQKIANGLNGKDCLLLDGIDDFFEEIILPLRGTLSYFAVIRPESKGVDHALYDSRLTDIVMRSYMLWFKNNNKLELNEDFYYGLTPIPVERGTVSTPLSYINVPIVVNSITQRISPTDRIIVNNQTVATNADYLPTAGSDASFTFFNRNIGSFPDGTQTYKGRVGEIIMFSSLISDSNAYKINNYLMKKWNIS